MSFARRQFPFALHHSRILLLLLYITSIDAQTSPARSSLQFLALLPARTCLSPNSIFAATRNASCLVLPSPRPSTTTLATLNLMLDISKSHYFRPLSRSSGPADTIVLFFGGTWCEWSRTFRPVWERDIVPRFPHICLVAVQGAKKQFGGEAPAAAFGVAAFPAIVAFKGGAIVARYSGKRGSKSVVDWVARVGRTWAENEVVFEVKRRGWEVNGVEERQKEGGGFTDNKGATEYFGHSIFGLDKMELDKMDLAWDNVDWVLVLSIVVTCLAGVREFGVKGLLLVGVNPFVAAFAAFLVGVIIGLCRKMKLE